MEGVKIIEGKTKYDEPQYTVTEQDYTPVDEDKESSSIND